MCQNSSAKIYSEEIITGVCNGVYFRLYIDPIYINPPVTSEGFDGRGMPNARSPSWFLRGDDDGTQQVSTNV